MLKLEHKIWAIDRRWDWNGPIGAQGPDGQFHRPLERCSHCGEMQELWSRVLVNDDNRNDMGHVVYTEYLICRLCERVLWKCPDRRDFSAL